MSATLKPGSKFLGINARYARARALLLPLLTLTTSATVFKIEPGLQSNDQAFHHCA